MSNVVEIRHHLAGRYKLSAIRPDGSVRKLTDWFDNLITDAGMDQIGNGGTGSFGIGFLFTVCKVGTGNTPPAFTDTALQSLVASVGPVEGVTPTFVEGTPAYWSVTKSFRFGTGVAAGNLSEIGVFDGASGAAFSRALITDSGGTPITVTVLSDEILDVTYELRSYIDKTMYTDAILISGVGYSMQRMPATIGTVPEISKSFRSDAGGGLIAQAWDSNGLGTVYQSIPAGTVSGNADSLTMGAYVAGSFFRDITFTFSTAVANFSGGVGSVILTLRQTCMKVGFTPKVPKVNTNNLSLTFRVTWARYP